MVWNFVVNCSDPFSLLYLLSSDTSATLLPSVWSWKGCRLWLLAFHLKTTEINWILKYFTCSPSTCNSCFSQNNGQVGSLQELIQKVERTGQRKWEWPWILPMNSSVLFNSCPKFFKRWFQSKVLVSNFSWRKVPKWTKKRCSLTQKDRTWCSSCRQGAPQESIFSRKKR